MGTWNFTLQADTPLHWLRCGRLDWYLLTFKVSSPNPSTCGIVLHGEADGAGTDGASFWIERRPARNGNAASKRYFVAGAGLESKPIMTRAFPDTNPEEAEEVKVLMQGYEGCVMVQEGKVQLKFRSATKRGSIAFYNSTSNPKEGQVDDVHFGEVRITAMRKGPVDIVGDLKDRERSLNGFHPKEDEDHDDNDGFKPVVVRTSQLLSTSSPPLSPLSSSSPNVGNRRHGSAASRQQSNSKLSSKIAPGRTLQGSASEGVLRKTGSATLTGSNLTAKGGQGVKWVPMALNPHNSERMLFQDSCAPRRGVSASACQDFIVM